MAEQLPQVSKLAGTLVEHQRHFEELLTAERQWVIYNAPAAIELFVSVVKRRDGGGLREQRKSKHAAAVLDIGDYTVDYDKSIVEKLGSGVPQILNLRRSEWASDVKFPDLRSGKKCYKASAVTFRRLVADEDILEWCQDNKKRRATLKEGIDIILATSWQQAIDLMPLAMPGEFFVDADRKRHAPFFRLGRDNYVYLDGVCLGQDWEWHAAWWFLVLEELPSAD